MVATDLALEAHDLWKAYRKSPALEAAELGVPQGVIAGLVGPNGAGKSTLLRICVGFEVPDRGSVRVAGTDPQQNRSAALSRVGYVPQLPTLYRDLTLRDHVRLMSEFRPGFDRSLALRRLADLAIPVERSGADLSGGQRAQAYLALVLGLHAPLLLLDEPLASLDPLARMEFLDVLREAVREEGATAVLSSHVVTDVEMVCDYLLLLSAGRVVLDARIEDLLNVHWVAVNPEVGQTARTIAAFSPGGGKVRRLLAEPVPSATRATLEDIVLGYLSSGRDRRGGAA